MQKYDVELKTCLKKYLKNLFYNLDDARDDVRKKYNIENNGLEVD